MYIPKNEQRRSKQQFVPQASASGGLTPTFVTPDNYAVAAKRHPSTQTASQTTT